MGQHEKKGRVILPQTATPSKVETEVTALGRGRQIHVCTERKLTVHASPNQDEDHGTKHLRRRLPDSFSVIGVNIWSIVILGIYATAFSPIGLGIG